MEIFQDYKSEYALLIVRLVAGILFFAQGYDKVFRIHLRESGEASAQALRDLPFSAGFIKTIIVVTALTELICGAMLIVGLWILPCSYILAACLLPVTIAMSMKEPMWNVQQVMTRLALLVFLLVVPTESHLISVDHLLTTYGSKG